MKQLVSMQDYQSIIGKGKTVLLFTADWCGDCVFLAPFLPEIEADFPDYEFFSVNRDQFLDLCEELAVFGIPSFIVFENGQEIGRLVSKNRKTKEEIEAFLKTC